MEGAELNPMLLAALGSLLRFVLAYGAGYLTRLGVWEADEAEAYVTALASAAAFGLASLGWSLLQKYRARRVLLVALASSRRLAEEDAEALATAGLAPPVTTPATVVPVLEKR